MAHEPNDPPAAPVDPALRRRRRRRRGFAVVAVSAAALLTLAVGRPAKHLVSFLRRDVDTRETLPDGVIDDASRLNRTEVDEIWPIPTDPVAAERQLAQALRAARMGRLPVSIAGSRHSMGGHVIAPGGVVVDMRPFAAMELDDETGLLHVQSGARWSEIVPYLDARGKSVAVMQSNDSFTVGGSLSVNCHGWQFGRPPIASTVESFRLMRADGRIVRCSRTENAELFSLALGGYGLFGVILDAELRVVPNERYRLEQFVVPLDDALATFDRRVRDDPDVAMVYARMCVVRERFLEEVILTVFSRDPAPDGSIPRLTALGLPEIRRALFRGSVGDDYGKELRWAAETKLQPQLAGTHFSRNQLLNESADVYQDRSAATTDVLHEYFVPETGLAAFVDSLRRIVPRCEVDLLNVTVRFVDADPDSFLRYADRPMYAFVMLFNQPRTTEADAIMEACTQELIDAALAVGGRYYLPYRLHATTEQFRRAYPQAARFFERKREHDPQELFQNQFYRKYGRKP